VSAVAGRAGGERIGRDEPLVERELGFVGLEAPAAMEQGEDAPGDAGAQPRHVLVGGRREGHEAGALLAERVLLQEDAVHGDGVDMEVQRQVRREALEEADRGTGARASAGGPRDDHPEGGCGPKKGSVDCRMIASC
jgi:hypothetical protein